MNMWVTARPVCKINIFVVRMAFSFIVSHCLIVYWVLP